MESYSHDTDTWPHKTTTQFINFTTLQVPYKTFLETAAQKIQIEGNR